ncbi:Prominin-1-A [Halotydeus destructor]|nr:Prominin-1-A [Halotydeus destructor]
MIPFTISFKFCCIALLLCNSSIYANSYSPEEYTDPMGDYDDENSNEDIIKPVIPWRQINFISPSQELGQTRWWYEAPMSFSARGMDHLYLMNQLAMKELQPPGVPNEILKDELFVDPLEVVKENRSQLLSHFWGMILTSTIGLCLAIVVPLVGLLVCCCWCDSGPKKKPSRSRSRGNHRESPYQATSVSSQVISPRTHRSKSRSRRKYKVESGCDSFCRSLCGTIHFALLLLVSFFVICAFVTNEYVRNGLHELPTTLNQSLDDVQLYLNNTQYEVNTLLRTNFGQLEDELNESLDKSGLIVKNRLALVSQAVALENLTEIVSKLDTIQTDLKLLAQETNELRNSLHLLSTGLHRAKKDLEKVFKECSHPVCSALRSKYRFILEKFRVSTRLDDLPDLSPLMNNISALLQADIVHEVQRGKQAFDRISIKIQTAVNDSIPDIKRQIRAVGYELASTAKDINEALRVPFKDIRRGKENIYIGAQYIEEYEVYRWYACLGASGIVLAVLACYTLGLLKGVCGHQPTVNEYRSRRRKPPSTFLLKCGIFFLFLFFGPLLLAAVALFLVGGVSDRVGCYYLEHPNDNGTKQIISLLQKQFDEQNVADSMKLIRGVKPNIAEVLSRCHQNRSLYNALQLYQYNKIQLGGDKLVEGFNISTILQFKDRYTIEERLETFLTKVDVNPAPIVILTREGNDLLDRLKDTSLGTLNFSSFAELVNQRVTPLDLITVANDLENEAKLLPPSQIDHSTSLKNIAIMLESYQLKVISKIHHSVERLRSGAGKIEKKAQYGSRGLKEALTDLLNQAKKAQSFIEQKGRTEIRKVAKGFVQDMSSLIDQYSQHVVGEVENSVGRCEPVSRAVNASVMAICKEVVLPFNGYWLSMSSSLLLLLPATFCAYVLSNLYSKLKRGRNRRHIAADSDLALENLEEDDIPLAHVAHKNESSSYAVDHRGRHSYLESGTSAPSAPVPLDHDNWSPGAPPPHMYSRPPPYNFANS